MSEIHIKNYDSGRQPETARPGTPRRFSATSR